MKKAHFAASDGDGIGAFKIKIPVAFATQRSRVTESVRSFSSATTASPAQGYVADVSLQASQRSSDFAVGSLLAHGSPVRTGKIAFDGHLVLASAVRLNHGHGCRNLRGNLNSLGGRVSLLKCRSRASMQFFVRGAIALATLASVLVLAGCMTSSSDGARAPSRADLIDQIREVDLSPRFARPLNTTQPQAPDNGARAVTYYGSDAARDYASNVSDGTALCAQTQALKGWRL
jgi:hypothetical protein